MRLAHVALSIEPPYPFPDLSLKKKRNNYLDDKRVGGNDS